jgi:sodium transport system ATP-binding protein
MIKVTQLRKTFGAVTALEEVSFEARDGEITGLLGPNGAGKTTCLRILYTLMRPDSGQAEVDGFDTQRQALEVGQRTGALPEKHGLYPRMTARENIRYYGQLHGLQGADLAKRVNGLAELLDMSEIIDRRTEGFSTGQTVKVAIARALIHDPHNILLDEPTSGLDVMATRAMRDFIRRLRDQGRCVLLSSHIMQEVSALCDQIIIIHKGRIAAQGTPDELVARTGQANLEDAFVAAIGTPEGLE